MSVLHFLLVDFCEGSQLLVVTGGKQSQLLLRPVQLKFRWVCTFGVEFDTKKNRVRHNLSGQALQILVQMGVGDQLVICIKNECKPLILTYILYHERHSGVNESPIQGWTNPYSPHSGHPCLLVKCQLLCVPNECCTQQRA